MVVVGILLMVVFVLYVSNNLNKFLNTNKNESQFVYSVRNPHDLGGGIGMVERVTTYKLGYFFIQRYYLNLLLQNKNE